MHLPKKISLCAIALVASLGFVLSGTAFAMSHDTTTTPTTDEQTLTNSHEQLMNGEQKTNNLDSTDINSEHTTDNLHNENVNDTPTIDKTQIDHVHDTNETP